MFDRLRKTVKTVINLVIIVAVVLAYTSYRSEINEYVPVEEYVFSLWSAFKNFIAQFAVVPEYTPRIVEKPKVEPKLQSQPVVKEPVKITATSFVTHKKDGQEIVFGYDSEGKLVSVDDSGKEIRFLYTHDGFIEEISDASRKIVFDYNPRGELIKITDGDDVTAIKYNFYGFVSKISLPKDTLTFEFDNLGRLVKFRRGVGYETTLFNKENHVVSLNKGSDTTDFLYNQYGLLKLARTGDDYWVLNYGKDLLLSYFAGTKHNLGETISYNTNDVSVVSKTDNSFFVGGTEPVRFDAVNIYLACSKFKKLPVFFDPLAYVIYTNYFKKDLVAYVVNNFVCDVVYGRGLI